MQYKQMQEFHRRSLNAEVEDNRSSEENTESNDDYVFKLHKDPTKTQPRSFHAKLGKLSCPLPNRQWNVC